MLEAELPPLVLLALDPSEVALPVELSLDMSLEPLVIDAVELRMAVPLGPATAVMVELAAEATELATTRRVVLEGMPPTAPPMAPPALVIELTALLMTLLALLIRSSALLMALLTGAGMPEGPVLRKVAAAGCDVTADAKEVTTSGCEVTTDCMPVMTPRELVIEVYEVNGFSCDLLLATTSEV